MTREGQFGWTVEPDSWPPRARPTPPFGVTQIEVIRSCALRSCFEVSRGQDYERRTGPDARIGQAFHRTIQSLRDDPLIADTPPERAAQARQRFASELQHQDDLRRSFPREISLTFNQDRVHRAAEAIMLLANRISPHVPPAVPEGPATGHSSTGQEPLQIPPLPGTVEHEVPVRSADGDFTGRVDLAEHLEAGTRIVDFKSAFRDDLPGRYIRQLQLYAWMWAETRGSWPTEGQVVYPFTGRVHSVSVDPAECRQVAQESREIVKVLTEHTSPSTLATPGDTCKVCEFRPWCRPFWTWQSAVDAHRTALERAGLGFEGKVKNIQQQDSYWNLVITWRNAAVHIATPVERFPHLSAVSIGARLRILDVRLCGQLYQPNTAIGAASEIWMLKEEDTVSSA